MTERDGADRGTISEQWYGEVRLVSQTSRGLEPARFLIDIPDVHGLPAQDGLEANPRCGTLGNSRA
jgi:hypothetical protein